MPDNDYSNITEDSDIKQDLGLNSIGFLYLVLGIEEEFNVEIHNINAPGIGFLSPRGSVQP